MVEAPERIFYHSEIDLTYLTEAGLLYGAREYTRSDIAERQIAELRDHCNAMELEHRQAIEEMQSAEAENARLRALPLKDEVERVLEPFANLADAVFHVDEDGREMNATKPDDQPLWGFDRVEMTYGHLRTARSLFSRLRVRAGEQEGKAPAEVVGLDEYEGEITDPIERAVADRNREARIHAAAPSEQGGDRG